MPPSQRWLTYGMPTRVACSAIGLLGLLLGADEQDRAAVGDGLLDELVGPVDVGQRLLQVDDVDAVALGEDEALHLRVPAPGLVPEVDAALQQLLHGDDGHGRCSPLGPARPAGPRVRLSRSAGRRHRPGVAPEPGPVGHAPGDERPAVARGTARAPFRRPARGPDT